MIPILDKEKIGFQTNKQDEEDEDVDCPETKLLIWHGDEYDELEPDYLNQIYPYKLNKKTLGKVQFIFHFLSSSLHYWIELNQTGEPEEQKFTTKDTECIRKILLEDQSDNYIAFQRWSKYFNSKKQFHCYEDQEINYQIPKGELIDQYQRGNDRFQIIKYYGDQTQFIEFKKRFEVLFLFYIDGVSFVNQEIDTWIYYVVYKRKGQKMRIFVGVLSLYVFRISSLKERHRISQVLILPTYQKYGHGKKLLDITYEISLKNSQCFEITTEIPSFQFQCLRDYKECEMLINNKILNLQELQAVDTAADIQINKEKLLCKGIMRKIKQELKIPGHQIERLVNILIYAHIQTQQEDMPLAYFEEELRQLIIINLSPFKTRKKLPHLTIYGETPQIKQFLLEREKEDAMRNQNEVQQILTETLNGYRRVIKKLRKLHLIQ